MNEHSFLDFVGFQKRKRQDSQNLANDTFYRSPVTSAQFIFGTEIYPDSAILLNYNGNDYSQGYGQIKQAFMALTKIDKLQPYISEHDFRSSNDGIIIGYNLYVFDVRYQKRFEGAQPIKVDFKVSEKNPAGVYGYALLLTNRILSIGPDRQRHFDLF